MPKAPTQTSSTKSSMNKSQLKSSASSSAKPGAKSVAKSDKSASKVTAKGAAQKTPKKAAASTAIVQKMKSDSTQGRLKEALPDSPHDLGPQTIAKMPVMTTPTLNRTSTDAKAGLTGSAAAPTEKERRLMIQDAAYHIAERNGFKPGHEQEYWLQAEQQISEQLAQVSTTTSSDFSSATQPDLPTDIH